MSAAASMHPATRCRTAARHDSAYAAAAAVATNTAASARTETLRRRKSEMATGIDTAAGMNHITAETDMGSVFYRFTQILLLVDLPHVVHAVAVEIDHGRCRGTESVLRSLDDLDKIIGLSAVGHEARLFESQLLDRWRVARLSVEIRFLQGVQVGQLLLRLGGLCARYQRHEVRQGDEHQNADDDQYHQQLRERKRARRADAESIAKGIHKSEG